jgi:hypothetical protein
MHSIAFFVPQMKQRKIAISLAVVGAIAAPFVFHTYKTRPPTWRTWIPLTAEIKENTAANLKSTNNCQVYEDRNDGLALKSCRFEQKALEEGGVYGPRPSMPLYLLLNAAVAVAAFGIIFGLTYLLPALARRYRRWLNT